MNKTLFIAEENAPTEFILPSFKESPDIQFPEIVWQPSLKLIYANSPLEKWYNQIIKRIADIILSSVLIVTVLSWLIPVIAVLIKLNSPGPVFFLQKRNKKNGKIFTCIKFRSMIVNQSADKIASYVNDNRITVVGKYLRHHHLDELPQLFNVFLGDMSLIGPRPHMLIENIRFEKQLKEYRCRHQVKPGITGLAQSYGHCGSTRSLEEMKRRVNIDLIYVRKWSLLMDLKILLRTFRMMTGK